MMVISRRQLIALVIEAGDAAFEAWHSGADKQVEFKNDADLVTVVDKETQRRLVLSIGKATERAEVRFIAEEQDTVEPLTRAPTFIIDPIDGTTNFVSGLPHWCVSVGFWLDGEPQLGVVYAPATREVFSAERGIGAWVATTHTQNAAVELPIKISDNTNPRHAVGCSGIFGETDELRRGAAATIGEVLVHFRDVRRHGAAALDLCYVASGRYDLFWEGVLKSWDVAAGALIATEAGARVTPYWAASGPILDAGSILAGTPSMHEWFRQTIFAGRH